jgi:hypothetical protein
MALPRNLTRHFNNYVLLQQNALHLAKITSNDVLGGIFSMLYESVYKKGLIYDTNTCKLHRYKLSLKTVAAGNSSLGGTVVTSLGPGITWHIFVVEHSQFQRILCIGMPDRRSHICIMILSCTL